MHLKWMKVYVVDVLYMYEEKSILLLLADLIVDNK